MRNHGLPARGFCNEFGMERDDAVWKSCCEGSCLCTEWLIGALCVVQVKQKEAIAFTQNMKHIGEFIQICSLL